MKGGRESSRIVCNNAHMREVPERGLPEIMEDGVKLGSLLRGHPGGSVSADSKGITLETGDTEGSGRERSGITEKQWHTDRWRKGFAVEGAKCAETGGKE
jgi:hypothetical protein